MEILSYYLTQFYCPRRIVGAVCLAPCLLLVPLATGSACGQTDDWAVRRASFYEGYSRRLTELAERAETAGDLAAAARLRTWHVRRDPHCRVYFLDPSLNDDDWSRSGAETDQRGWSSQFQQLRSQHAELLWELADAAFADGRYDDAFQLAHEILREDSDHARAREVLGYSRRDDHWRRTTIATGSKIGRTRNNRLGWKGGTYWQVDTEHFQVLTNHSQQAGEDLAEKLEDMHCVWQQLFLRYWQPESLFQAAWKTDGARARLGPRHRVVLFADRQQYIDHLKPVEPQIEISLGIYRDRDRMAFYYAGDAALESTWVHEATHQLFHETGRVAANVGADANFWAVEGVALYMESLRYYDGYCTVGGIDADRLQYARYRVLSERYWRPIDELCGFGRQRLQQDPEIRRLYSLSAGWAHFLIDGQRGRYHAPFVKYLRTIYDGKDGIETLSSEAGGDGAKLEAEFRDFLQVTDDDLLQMHDPQATTKLCVARTQVTDRGLSAFSSNRRLVWLDVGYCDISDAGVLQLKTPVSLEQLNLEHTKIGSGLMPFIASCPELRELDLSGTAVNDLDISNLRGLGKLQVLWLTGTRVTDAVLPTLSQLKTLQFVNVDQTGVSPAGWEQLKRTLPNLKLPQ
ncbi:MAG: hypothetical protein R3E01_07745 [Pirellulaceae bacterium]|nr:hypothetical protein [Planctomycetales bacterium]